MKNGRCRLHGGKSTGAKTPQGKAGQRLGNFKHGCYSHPNKRRMADDKTVVSKF